MTLTAERLRELLRYDPETGIFTRRIAGGRFGRFPPGTVCGYVTPMGYSTIRIDGPLYGAHRLAWLYITGAWPPHQLDHINGIRSDNRWINLRPATLTENNRNKRVHRQGEKGAYFDKSRGKWLSTICVNRKQIFLGRFDTEQEAHLAYCSAAKNYYGEFARFK